MKKKKINKNKKDKNGEYSGRALSCPTLLVFLSKMEISVQLRVSVLVFHAPCSVKSPLTAYENIIGEILLRLTFYMYDTSVLEYVFERNG